MSKEYIEALETLQDMLIGNGVNDNINDYVDNLILPIKQALLKAKKNARSEEILQKYYQEGITLDSVRELKKENIELRQKAQEPKHYLKWEDLEFDVPTTIKVKMGDTQYLLSLRISLSDVKSVVLRDNNLKPFLHLFEKEKQFFNDLHLERVKE